MERVGLSCDDGNRADGAPLLSLSFCLTSLAITDEERRRVFGTVEGIYGWEGKRTVRYTVAGRKRG